jgi:quercetin dioxygenase-like cupin family protein
MPADTSKKLHYHEFAQQFFFILAGTASFTVDEQTITVPAQHGWHILPGLVHHIIN